MMKQYLLVMVALLAVVGCQRRPLNGGDPDGGEACMVRFQAENQLEVKAGSDPVTPVQVDLTPGSTVLVVAYQRQSEGQTAPNLDHDTWKATSTYKVLNDYTLSPCHVNDDGTVNTTVTTPAKGMELHNGTYDFYAYSPARKLDDNQTVSGLGHYEDFMSAYAPQRTISRSSSTVALAFEHECTKVTFTATHAAGMTSSDLFADSVVLRQIATTNPAVTYTIGSDVTPTAGTTADTGVIRTFAYLDAAQKGDGATGHEIFLPKASGKVPAEFYIQVNGTPYLLKAELPAETTYEKGHNYIYTAKVKQGSVDLVLNVVSWNHVLQDNPGMGADNGSILIGSWGGIDWNGSIGGNPDEVTAPIQVGSWTSVSLPSDFISGQPGQVSGWGAIEQDNTGIGQ